MLLFAGSRPQLRDVHNLVTPDYAAHWRAISTQLGLKVGLLDTIDHDHHHKAEDCCNAVWEQWLDMDTTASWSKVIEAVESSAVVSVLHKTAVIDNSTKDTVSEPLTNARNQLQEFYTNERYKGSEDDWPSYQPEHFTSVALIHHREKHVTTREVIAIANVLHKGEVNVGCASNENQQGSSYLQYYDSKISTNIAEIFCKLTSHTSQGEQKVILIEGSPGIGKTILSKEIAFQWAKNKLLNEKMLLFLIFLRDPYLQNVQTLEHFVCYAISSTQRNSMVASVEQYLEETSGKHCVVVCDGYDEISEEVRCNSFISKLISRKVLKLSSLVITSRPTTSACLHGIADRRVEILGFTKEDRNRYIHQSLAGNTVEIRLIEEYFEVNPFIDSLCYIPLNMTILICLLKESLGTCSGLPKTQTEINKQFTFVTIARYLRRHHNHILTVKFLQNLPMPYKEQLDNLAKLAFVFLGKDKIVFNDDDVANDCPDCVGKWDSLGLLKIVKYSSLLADSTSFSYNFLHFSVQEYLAAFYIASLSDKKQAKILKNYFWNSKYLNMGIMYFGLTGGDSVALKHFLSGNKFFFFSKFFGANQIERRVSEDKVKCLHLFQCFLEADNDKLIQKVGKILEDDTIDLSNNALLHKDIHILSFFLVRSANKTWRSLDLSGCYIGDQGFDIFAKSFAECSKNRTTIKAVYLPYNYLTSSSINGIINLILCFKVEKITLSNNNNINYEDFDDKLLRSSIDDNRVIKMVAEKTEGCELSIYFINCNFNLKENVVLCKPNLTYDYYFWNANIQLCDINTLTSVHFTCLSVYEDSLNSNKEAVDIASLLQQLSHLGQCHVEYVLQSNTSLFASNTKITKITQALKNKSLLRHEHPSNDQWKIFDLYRSSISDTGLQVIIPYFIKQGHIMYFDTFNISKCSLTELSISTILDLLKGCVIRKLIISDNSIPNGLLHKTILREVYVQSKLLNFSKQVPIALFNNDETNALNTGTELVYSVTKYLVNCNIDADTVTTASNFNDSYVSYELFLSNVELMKEDVETIMVLCKNPFLTMSIFQMNISEELQNKIVCTLQNSRKHHYSYVLTSDSQLVAYKAKQENITEAYKNKPDIHTLEIIQCELDFSELSLLHPIFKNFSKQWNTIDLSGCSIGDEGCDALCKSFFQYTGYINTLNLFNNGLTSISVNCLVNLLRHCVVEKIILTSNRISGNDIYTSLSTNYSSNNVIMNFTNKIPLLIIVRVPHLDNMSCIYLVKSSVYLQVLQKMVNKNGQFYDVFIVDDVIKEIHNTVQYYDSCLTVYPIPSDILDNQLKIIKAFKQKQIIASINVSFLNFTDTSFHVLCNQLFNPESVLKYITQLNLSGNKLTSSCLQPVMESLQHCTIQQVIIFQNHVRNVEVIDIITDYFSNSNIHNFRLGIPLMVINNSTIFQTGYTGMLFLKNICKSDHIHELITAYSQGFTITDYVIFFTHSNIMVDDLNDSLSILYNTLPHNTKIVVYETDVADEVADKIAKFLTKGFTQGVGFILSSITKLLVHSFFYEGITSNLSTVSSLNTLQITNCKLEPDQLKVTFDASCMCKHINLSGCHIGDEGLKLFYVSVLRSTSIPHIDTLNISVNSLTSCSIRTIIKLLSDCIVEHLVISGNDIDDEEFNQALCIQRSTSKNVANFFNAIPLVVRGTVLDEDITVCNAYITAIETTNMVCSLVIDDSAQYYYIYYLDGEKRTVVSFKNKNMSGFIGQASATLLPLITNSVKLIFERKLQENLDITQYNFDSRVFSSLCMMIFNKHSLLRHVTTLTLSSNQLSVECMTKFVDCLQYCCFDHIIIYEYNTITSFAEILFKRFHEGKSILNSIAGKPLTLINYTYLNRKIAKKHAITFLLNCEGTTHLTEVITSLQYKCDVEAHKLVLFNFLSKNQTSIDLNFIQLVLQKSAIVSLMIYEIGIKDETALEIVDVLQTIQERVEFVLTSKTMFMVYRTRDTNFFHSIANTSSIDTFVLKLCVYSQETYTHIGHILSTMMENLKRITLSRCYQYLNDHIYQEFSRMFFHDRAVIHYLKKLDISHNHITSSCVKAIISSLRTCIIEKLVISHTELNNKLVNSVFVSGYHQGDDLLNFIKGVPLIIINIEQGDQNYFTSFVVNCAVNDSCINLLSDISDYEVHHYNLFLLNNCIKRKYVDHATSSLQHLIQKVEELTLFGTDFTDEIAIVINDCLCKATQMTIEYFLVSDSKLITDLSKMLSTRNNRLIDIVGCSIGEEMFGMFCKSVFHEVDHIRELDVSAYQLTSVCVNMLIKSLQNCSIEKLILVNHNNVLDKITDVVFDVYATKKQMQNFTSGIPLIILCYTKDDKNIEVWGGLFCVNIYVNDEFEKQFSRILVNNNYAQLQCVFINFFSNNQRMIPTTSKYLSNCFARKSNKVILYEADLWDETAKCILEQLTAVQEQVQYVLVSPKMILAFRACASLIIKAIFGAFAKYPFISMIKLKSIKFCESLLYIIPFLSRKFKYLKNLALMGCHLNDEKYERLSKSLFNNKSVISYLKELDISQNNIKFSSVISLINSLQYCVVERLVVPDKTTNDDLSNAVFFKAYSKGEKIVNFITGVPLIIINYANKADGSSTYVSCFKAFLIDTIVNEQTINLISDASGHNIYHYSLFVKDNALLCDFNYIALVFDHLMKKIAYLSIFGTDLMDEVALKIVHYLKEVKTNAEYFLASQTKTLTSETMPTSTLSMSRAIVYKDLTQIPENLIEPTGMFCKSLAYSEILYNGTPTSAWSVSRALAYDEFKQIPDVLYELAGMFCMSLSCSADNFLKHFRYLDLSSYQFSSAYTKLLCDSLQRCCIEQLVLSVETAKHINDHILDGYFEGKRLYNTTLGLPLKVLSGTEEMPDDVTYEIDIYLVEICMIDEMLENIAEECYKKIRYILLNASQKMCILSNRFYLKIPFCSFFICELGLQNETALAIAKKLITARQYVLTSKTLLLAYNADMSSIIKALKCNTLIITINLNGCKISTSEFKGMLIAKFKHLRNISFSHCSIGWTNHKYDFLYDSIFSTGARILYLKRLDLSTFNCQSLHVNTITTSLQSCIIEKIILSDNRFNDELVNAIFISAYYKRNYIVNFKTGVPLIVINIVQRKKSSTDVSNFTIFLMNAELNNVINTIIDVSGYDVQDYKLFLIRNNVLENSSDVFVQFQYLLLVLKSVTLFGTDLMEDLAWKIATYLGKISNLSIEFSLFYKNTSLTKVKNIQRILSIAKGGKIRNIIDTPLILSLTLGCQLDLIDISYCNVNNNEFMIFQELLSRYCTTIKVLDVSHNRIPPSTLSKTIMDFHVKKLHLNGDFFHFQDTITELLPNVNHNIEIKFSECTIFIICDESGITNIFNLGLSVENILHIFVINRSNNMQNNQIDIILQTLKVIPLPILSSVNWYSNSFEGQDIINLIENLMHINLFIEGCEFYFKSVVSDNQFKNIHGILYSTSEYCSSVLMQWTPPSVSETKYIEFCFEDLTMINYAKIIAQKYLIGQDLCTFKIANAYVIEDVVKEIATVISNSDVLEYLGLVNLIIHDRSLLIVLQELENIYSLRSFTINSINILGNTCADHIAHIIASNKSLENVEIANCNLKETAIVQISKSIKTANSLLYLDLSNNIISNVAAGKLASALNEITTLKHLDLSGTKLQESDIIGIMQGLSNCRLQYLLLNNCNITKSVATEIALCVPVNFTSLVSLELSNCKLVEVSLLCILEALTSLSSLCKLNLSYNIITEMVAVKLAKVITNNPTITNISLTPSDSSITKVMSSCTTLSALKCIDFKFLINSIKFSKLAKDCLENILFMVKIDYVDDEYASIGKDVREISHWTYTNCSNREMFNCLESLSSLHHLDVNTSTITYNVISNTIKNNIGLKYINISNCCWQESCSTVTAEDTIYVEIIVGDDIDTFYVIAKSLSSLQQIEYLDISGNKITNKIARAIGTTIHNNKRLQHLNLSNCQLQTTGFLTILNALSSVNNLSYLDVSYNHFSNEVSKLFTGVIKSNRKLVQLNLSNCKLIEGEFLNGILPQHLVHTRHLNFSRNILSCKIISALGLIIISNANLQWFDISHCKLSEEGMKTITSCLKMINSLKHLNISCCAIHSSSADDLAAALSCNRGLEHLNLADCQVQEMSIIKILQELAKNSTLKYLNLKSNLLCAPISSSSHKYQYVSSKAIMELVGVVNNNMSLEYINLSNCGLLISEVTDIVAALSGLSHLQYIDISHSIITDEATVGISSVITNNPSLEHFCMSNCSMKEDVVEKVTKALVFSRSLHTLDLGGNCMNELAAKNVSTTISNSQLLEHLNLSSCSQNCFNFYDTMFDHFKNLKYYIKYLDLGSNPINYHGARDLASFFCESFVIEYIDFSNCNLSEFSLLKILSSLQAIRSLRHLNLGTNVVTKESAVILKHVIVANRDLKYLLLPSCDPSGHVLEEIICVCGMMEYLDFSYNVISDHAAYDLSIVIDQSVSLQYLNINKCTITRDGKEFVTKAIADVECLQCSVVDENTLQHINVAVFNNAILFIFSLSNHQISADLEIFNVVKPLYYINFTPFNCSITEELPKYVESAFFSKGMVYLSIANCDLGECSLFVILEAAKHINTLQCLNLRSSRIPLEAMGDIVLTILRNVGIKKFNICDCELSGFQITAMLKALSTLRGLRYLDISHNIVSEEVAVELETVVINNTSLEYLNVSTCGLKDSIISIISHALSNSTSLVSLDISNNHITTVETANHLAAVVRKQAKLQTVNFSNCFDGEIIHKTLDSFEITRTLKFINLESNSISYSSANIIKSFLSENTMIEYLNLSNCGIPPAGLLNILSVLGQVTTLQYLILASNAFTNSMTRKVKAIIENNKTLKHMDLSDCKLSLLQLTSCLLLSCHSSIQHLNLSLNSADLTFEFGNANLVTFDNEKLMYLDLSYCKLPYVAVNHIFMLSSYCKSLTHLNLHSCTITEKVSLKALLYNKYSLQYLNVCSCNLQEEQIIVIVECLRKSNSLQHLLLNSNIITDVAAIQIASMIISSISLKQLALSDCELEELGLLNICKSLQKISSIQHLDLSYNIISDEVAVSIASSLSNNTSLEYLDMSYCTWPNNGLAIIQSTLDLQKLNKLKEADFTTW